MSFKNVTYKINFISGHYLMDLKDAQQVISAYVREYVAFI